MVKVALLVISFTSYSDVYAADPIMNARALYCSETAMKFSKPEQIESIYCGYKVGIKHAGKHLYFPSGVFSTQENLDGHILWKRKQLTHSCEQGEKDALERLKRDYPLYVINCSKYLNYDDQMFDALKVIPLSNKPPSNLAESSDIIVISGYRPSNQHTINKIINVNIDRPRSNVLLVLSSYEKINWKIAATQDTSVAGIVAYSRYGSSVTTSIDTKGYSVPLPPAYETDSQNFSGLLAELNALFGINKIDVFRGSYDIPTRINVTSLDKPMNDLTLYGPTPVKSSSSLNFTLLKSNFERSDWTLEGPRREGDVTYLGESACLMTRYVTSDSGNEIYSTNGTGLEIRYRDKRLIESIELPLNFPRFVWGTDVAFDSIHKIVSVVTHGGEGFIYRFDTVRREWIDFNSLNYLDIRTITYNKKLDGYIAWSGKGELIQISNLGAILSKRNVAQLLTGIGRVYNVGNSPGPCFSLAAYGSDIALIDINVYGRVNSVWHYNFKNGKAGLTYQAKKK